MDPRFSASSRLTDGLIPRRVLFGPHNRSCVRISRDGSQLAWLADHNGASNVWVAPTDDLGRARAVTPFRKGAVVDFVWGFDRHIIVTRDVHGDECHRLHSVDVDSGRVEDLIAAPGVSGRLIGLSPSHPHHAMVSSNDRDPRRHDLYRVDLRDGSATLALKNESYRNIVAIELELMLFEDDRGEWTWQGTPVEALHPGDEVITVEHEGQEPFVTVLSCTRHSDTRAVVRVGLKSGGRDVLFGADHVDVDEVLCNPQTGAVQAVAFCEARLRWAVRFTEVESDFALLREVERGDVRITSQSTDGRYWTVAFDRGDAPVRYYLYDRQERRAERLFAHNWALEGLRLAPMRPTRIKAHDLSLVGYLSEPPRRKGRVPLVLLVHGGPHARDYWGYDDVHQWLADRGYAVLSVNFRGSTGFGEHFVEAGRRQWGRRMQDDLDVAARWAVGRGIADPDRIAIMGASYGGYAALAGLAFNPKRFACGIAFAGPSNLVSLVSHGDVSRRDAQYWWIGDPRTPEGRRHLLERSPAEYVEWIEAPLLVAHGTRDIRVPRHESDRLVQAMRRHNKRVTYVVYHDEGHGLVRSNNVLGHYALVEAFLAKHLRGRAEPIGEDLEEASYRVLCGIEHIPGLRAADERRRRSTRPPRWAPRPPALAALRRVG